jgi:NodT family efflux transporter outer membrane factor (OMF) lipoprotein
MLTALLAGCSTVGPDYREPAIAVPERFIEAQAPSPTADAELSAWWRAFGDPQLSSLIELALVQNLDVDAASARIREARALEREAGARRVPQVGAEASAARQRISENAIPVPPGAGGGNEGAFGPAGSEFSTFRIGFDASWELDLFGRTRRAIEAARARTGAAIWNRRDVEVSVAAEVASAYFRLRTLQARLDNARDEHTRQQRFERLIGARTRGGLVIGQDLKQQQSERAAAAAAIPVLEAQAEAEIHALGVLVGSTPGALARRVAEPARFPAVPAVPPGLPSELIRRRPDVRAAERELAAATADIGVAVGDLYPRVSLTAAPALVSTALASLLDWASRGYTIGAALDWPLFDGGRRRASVDVRTARQEQALVAFRKSVVGALRDVEDALSRIDGDRTEMSDLTEALAAASRAEEIARTRYRGGLTTYSDVLQAQARRIALEDRRIEARGKLARDTVALAKALGGGWPDLAAEGGPK